MCPKAKRAEHDMHITIDSIVVETLTGLLYFILNYISYQANQKRHNSNSQFGFKKERTWM